MREQRLPPPKQTRFPVWDLAVGAIALGAIALTVHNVFANMAAAGLRPGFGFLFQQAGFDVSESFIPYSANDSYARVILTGLLNTIFLSVVTLILANLIGLAIGFMSVGVSPIGRLFARVYVEVFRNLPKILILLVLYVVSINSLPTVRNAISLGSVHISNRSFYFPSIVPDPGHLWIGLTLVAGLLLAYAWSRHVDAQQQRSGRRDRVVPVAILAILGLPVAVALLMDISIVVSFPVFKGFDYEGGARLSLQFIIVAVTLATYHGAQIGEVVRGGIVAVPKGQVEAAASLGLKPALVSRLVVFPQVLRIVIPPLGNQYVNLVKNTSIAIAVGYSDLMSVAGTTINQTFRPLEMMLITMALYLLLCMLITVLLNTWNSAQLRQTQRT